MKDYVDITLPITELAERMTLAGLEVGAIEHIGAEWDREKIFVGEIVEVQPHPNADRLTIAVVEYGMGEPMAAYLIKAGRRVSIYITARAPRPSLDGERVLNVAKVGQPEGP